MVIDVVELKIFQKPHENILRKKIIKKKVVEDINLHKLMIIYKLIMIVYN